jgi:hypothetical protein
MLHSPYPPAAINCLPATIISLKRPSRCRLATLCRGAAVPLWLSVFGLGHPAVGAWLAGLRGAGASSRLSMPLIPATGGAAPQDAIQTSLSRESLGRPARAAAPFSLITYGRSSKRVHHDPSDFDAVLEEEDRDRLRR